jgi:hypothetical protein
MKNSQSFSVSVLLHKDGDAWVAQCLEYDVAAQGVDIPDAKDNFLSTLEAQIRFDLADGKVPLVGLPPAPRSYRDHLGRAFVDGPELPVCVPVAPPKKSNQSSKGQDNFRIAYARFLQKQPQAA